MQSQVEAAKTLKKKKKKKSLESQYAKGVSLTAIGPRILQTVRY